MAVLDVYNQLSALEIEGCDDFSTGESPLGVACRSANIKIVSCILKKGENVNAKENHGLCPIHILCGASANYDEDARVIILEMLLQANVRVNEQDANGRTALHYACHKNHVSLVNRLIEANCNIEVQDCDGDTPFTITCRIASENWYFWFNDSCNDEEDAVQVRPEDFPPYVICQTLVKHGADPRKATLLPSAVLFSTIDIVNEFIDLGMDVNMMDENRRSALGCACSSSYIPSGIVKLLLEKGADPNQDRGGGKNKPIIMAYVYNSVDKIRVLLSFGARISNEEMSEVVSISLSKWFLENPEVMHEDSQELASWKLLLKAGFRPQLDMLTQKIKRVTLCNSYTEASPWIYNLLSPLSNLKDLCRVCIRSQLQPSIDDHIETLPLPNGVKEFLKFR